jgi:hypothetical protein
VIHIYTPTLVDGWEWALPMAQSDNMTIVELFGKPIADRWTPIPMRLLRQDEHGKPWKSSDMPWLGGHLLILKPRAAAVLRDLCLEAGEMLPLSCTDVELVAWNVTTVVDALDHERSKILRHSHGGVMWIKTFSFKSDLIEGLTAFRIPESRTEIFVSRRFVQRVREAELTGTSFDEVWPIN